MPSAQKRIFISHINEEAPLASVLKEWLEDSFPGLCEVFVSSDPDDLPAGIKWLDHIDKALEKAIVLLVLCSENSLHRPWINFEAGCAWRQRIAIIPICHSELTIGALPAPLREFQALKLEDGTFVQSLMRSVSNHLQLNRYPKVDARAMVKAIRKALQTIQVVHYTGRPGMVGGTPLGESAHRVLRKVVEAGGAGVFESGLQNPEGMPEGKLTYHLERLSDSGLIVGELVRETPKGRGAEWRYWATAEGRRIVFGPEED